jgi:hypothetical protein
MIDEALINGIRKNEETAFIKLYELYAKKIYKTAYMMTNDKGAAQDIVQEVFIKIFIRIDDLKNNFAFNSWLYRIPLIAVLTAGSFFTEFYTIEDYKSFTEQDERLYPNDNKTKGMRIYTTDNYYMTLVASRDLLFIIKAAQNNKCNFHVDEINLIKYTEDMKNKSIVFTSDVYLKCKFKDGSEKSGSFRGQITMVNENEKWKVNHYQVTNLEPKEIFTNIFDDKTNWVIQNLLPHPYDPEILENISRVLV